ncbi:MAG: glucose 1-dehydrogenase [Coriobacteriales bacterium]
MGRLSDKCVIVTGGANGIGAEIVNKCAEHGAKVMIGDVVDDKGEAHAAELREKGYDVQFRHLDVTDRNSWKECAEAAKEAFGKLNGLVNCAALSQRGQSLADLDLDWDWYKLIDVDLTGPFLGMYTVVPYMKEAGGGSIVNIGSVAGLTAQCGTNGYTASKGGLIALTRALAIECANDWIRCNCVCPTVTVTENVRQIFDTMEGIEEYQAADRAYPRFGMPEDHANATVFMLSEEASYITGQTLCVDGGYTAK